MSSVHLIFPKFRRRSSVGAGEGAMCFWIRLCFWIYLCRRGPLHPLASAGLVQRGACVVPLPLLLLFCCLLRARVFLNWTSLTTVELGEEACDGFNDEPRCLAE